MKLDIPYLLANLTVEEKAGLCSGANFWWTKAVERLGLPAIMVSDGPHGLRKQAESADHLGLNESVPAVCFPSGAGLAASFDRNLVAQLGTHLGQEARSEKLHTVLGPAINMKRSPLCGRNFEYLSEDPFVAGELAAAYTNAVQAQGVGVCVKHYAANNQEYRRMSTDTIADEQTLREIYLAAFEKTVKQASPWSLMCAYNRINGTYCCENEWLLTDVLRKDWGFDGVVMTDWGAMNNRVEALKAGLELEMPASGGINDKKIVDAIADGSLSLETLDLATTRLLEWIEKGATEEVAAYDKEAHHTFARKTAAACAVLLKNEGNVLPLANTTKAAFVGSFASAPRYQGGGSSHINAFRITNAVQAAADYGVTYAQGWNTDGITADAALLAEAVAAAKAAEVAVIFAGLPDSFESEGYDRTHMDLPACQNELIAAVCAAQPNTVVVLHNGSPVAMPWINSAAAVLEVYLGGQAVGEATVDVLFGNAEPTGRLAETFPLRLEDTPCYLQFPGNGQSVTYGEGVFIGYRWYDSRKMPVLFPFGHGLGYTTFALTDLTLSATNLQAGETLTATVTVTNTGSRAGSEVVQVYVAPPAGCGRPVHELKGFAKVTLAPGESQTVSIALDARSFAMYEMRIHDWYIVPGTYTIEAGTSSRNLPLQASVTLANKPLPLQIADWTTLSDVLASEHANAFSAMLDGLASAFGSSAGDEAGGDGVINAEMMQSMMAGMPLHSLSSFMPNAAQMVAEAIKKING